MQVAIPRLAACATMKTMRLVRGICTRAIDRLLDDGEGAVMSPDQWLEILLPVIADRVRVIDGEAGHDAAPQAGRDSAPQARPPAAAA